MDLENKTMVGAFFSVDKLHSMTPAERKDGFERLVSHGINTVMVESETYDDEVITDAHQMGLSFWGGISCFLAPSQEMLEQRPELWPVLSNGRRRPRLEWYNGVVPTVESYRDAGLERMALIVGDHDLDGFVLDFVRWPLHWEVELRSGFPPPLDSSFDRHTLELFRAASGMELPVDDPVRASTWIMANAPEAWIDFKCQVITSFAAAAKERITVAAEKPIPLGLCIVPLFPEWVGQRVEDLSMTADLICPMSYHPALYRSADWVARNVAQFVTASRVPIVPLLQIDTDGEAVGADLGPPVGDDEFAQIVAECFAVGTQGVSIFTGTELLRGGRLQALRRGLG